MHFRMFIHSAGPLCYRSTVKAGNKFNTFYAILGRALCAISGEQEIPYPDGNVRKNRKYRNLHL